MAEQRTTPLGGDKTVTYNIFSPTMMSPTTYDVQLGILFPITGPITTRQPDEILDPCLEWEMPICQAMHKVNKKNSHLYKKRAQAFAFAARALNRDIAIVDPLYSKPVRERFAEMHELLDIVSMGWRVHYRQEQPQDQSIYYKLPLDAYANLAEKLTNMRLRTVQLLPADQLSFIPSQPRWGDVQQCITEGIYSINDYQILTATYRAEVESFLTVIHRLGYDFKPPTVVDSVEPSDDEENEEDGEDLPNAALTPKRVDTSTLQRMMESVARSAGGKNQNVRKPTSALKTAPSNASGNVQHAHFSEAVEHAPETPSRPSRTPGLQSIVEESPGSFLTAVPSMQDTRAPYHDVRSVVHQQGDPTQNAAGTSILPHPPSQPFPEFEVLQSERLRDQSTVHLAPTVQSIDQPVELQSNTFRELFTTRPTPLNPLSATQASHTAVHPAAYNPNTAMPPAPPPKPVNFPYPTASHFAQGTNVASAAIPITVSHIPRGGASGQPPSPPHPGDEDDPDDHRPFGGRGPGGAPPFRGLHVPFDGGGTAWRRRRSTQWISWWRWTSQRSSRIA
jgi:hypothetical protein